MHPEDPARISSMDLSTATEDDCIVSREETRHDCERLSVDSRAARTAGTFNPIDSWASSATQCEIGHRFPKLGALDCRLGGETPSGWVYEMSSSHKLPKAGGNQSIIFACLGNIAKVEVAPGPPKATASEGVCDSQGRRVVELTDLLWMSCP